MALEPVEILVLANRDVSGSISLARYYMEKRGVPGDRLLPLRVSGRETCSREAYERKILAPVRSALQTIKGDVRCLVLMYGIPLRVLPPELTEEEKGALEGLQKQKSALSDRLVEEEKDSGRGEDLHRRIGVLEGEIARVGKKDQGASVDSELALAGMDSYPLERWVENPFFVGYGNRFEKRKNRVFMVARLDGPTEAVVKRLIDDGLKSERARPKGIAYFDARWPRNRKGESAKEKEIVGYAYYDESIHKAAELVEESGLMPVRLEDTEELFGPGDCPDAALYCGWYSLGRYVDAFEWRPGAVGYHIASSECTTLKRKKSQVWCKRMLEEGVAATLGPVGEPYVQAFPIPHLFFRFLLDGRWTLAECYALSKPFLSWRMILVGDPLYRPFQDER